MSSESNQNLSLIHTLPKGANLYGARHRTHEHWVMSRTPSPLCYRGHLQTYIHTLLLTYKILAFFLYMLLSEIEDILCNCTYFLLVSRDTAIFFTFNYRLLIVVIVSNFWFVTSGPGGRLDYVTVYGAIKRKEVEIWQNMCDVICGWSFIGKELYYEFIAMT